MIVLVTGAGGQVGQALLEARAFYGIELVGYPRADLDITCAPDVDMVMERVRPAVVVNAAAFTAVDQAEHDSEAAYLVNETGALNLARACARYDAAMIQVSTDYVFDGASHQPYREDDDPAPLNVYGRSKLGGERAVQGALERAIVLRTSWIYAAEGRNFVRTMLRLGRERESLDVVDDQIGAPTAAHEIAACVGRLLFAIGRDRALPWGIYHFTAAGQASRYDFAGRIFELARPWYGTGPKLRPIHGEAVAAAADRPKMSLLDCQKIARHFGIVAPDWTEGLACVLGEVERREAGGYDA